MHVGRRRLIPAQAPRDFADRVSLRSNRTAATANDRRSPEREAAPAPSTADYRPRPDSMDARILTTAVSTAVLGERRVTTLRTELIAACPGRSMSLSARDELLRLVDNGDDQEVEEVLRHLRHLPAVRRRNLNTDADTTARFVVLSRARRDRAHAHRRRLDRTACHLGEQVARGALTINDAQRQLERLAEQLDHEVTLTTVRLVPARISVEFIREGFAHGVNAARSA